MEEERDWWWWEGLYGGGGCVEKGGVHSALCAVFQYSPYIGPSIDLGEPACILFGSPKTLQLLAAFRPWSTWARTQMYVESLVNQRESDDLESTCVQVCKYASMQLCRCASVQMCKCASVQVCKVSEKRSDDLESTLGGQVRCLQLCWRGWCVQGV